MPANLTPEYHRAEAAYRSADTAQSRLDALQWMLRAIPKHKGTDRMQADLKSRIAILKQEIAKLSQTTSAKRAIKIARQGLAA